MSQRARSTLPLRRLVGLASAVLVAAVLSTVPAASEATGGWHSFTGANTGAIPDGPSVSCGTPGTPRDVTFDVSGLPAEQLADVRITGLNIAHTFAGDVTATLISPTAVSRVVFGRTGAVTALGFGDSSNLAGPYTFTDHATPNSGGWWQAAAAAPGTNDNVASGDYFATTPGGDATGGNPVSLTGAFAGMANPNGTWTLRFVDTCQTDTGSVSAATLELRTSSQTCAGEQTDVTFSQTQVTAATAGLTSAQATQTAAQAGVASAQTALTQAKAGVTKATKALKKAKKAKKNKAAKVKKAQKALQKAKDKLAAANLGLATSQGTLNVATQQVTAAQTALTTAQAALTDAQADLAACQAE